VCEDEPRDVMDSVGQWLYVVEIVRMCFLAVWPLYLGVFINLCS
jgi:hypothetical protein